MHPTNTGQVLRFLFPQSTPLVDWELTHDPGKAKVRPANTQIRRWSLAARQPTEAELVAAAGSPEFAAWLDTRTDPVKKRRAEAKQILATSNEPLIVAVRTALKGIGASLREMRQAQGKPVRNDNQFMADVLAGIDAGAGEV